MEPGNLREDLPSLVGVLTTEADPEAGAAGEVPTPRYPDRASMLRVERFRRGWIRTPAYISVPGEPDA